MALPDGNRFVGQQELMNHIGPDIQNRIVATSFCAGDSVKVPAFENLRINMLAGKSIRSTFMDADRPDLTDLGIPVLLLLGECSYLPRGYAMDYFEAFSISRSHLVSGVGHILWGNEEGARLTREAIMSFLLDFEMPLPDEPDYDSRIEFIELGR